MDKDDRLIREQLYDSLATAHGGYWRHGFVDHAYLYNLYFPPERFFGLLTENVRALVANYPVGQNTVAGKVGELIDQPVERIVVGNGAAELIKIVSSKLAKRMIVPVPSFNEYVDAAPEGAVVEFALDPITFELDVHRFADAAISVGADVAVVVTPNNPTSLSVSRADVLELATRLAPSGCMLIVDESFIDFAHDQDEQSVERDIGGHSNLAIFKSMSKAYGICGIRLGYLLTSNKTFAENVRMGLHIWNINGFAEAFLWVAPEYRDEFRASCAKVRADRDGFYQRLTEIHDVVVFRPDANYVLCRVPDRVESASEIARAMFVEHNMYIKHCAGKNMPSADRFLRIASRTPGENAAVSDALEDVFARVETRPTTRRASGVGDS